MNIDDLLKIEIETQDQVKRFGQLTALKDLVDEEIAETKPLAIGQILNEKGNDFTGRFLHTDGHTYEVRTDIDYPNIMDYDDDGSLRALQLQKDALAKKSSNLTKKINVAIDDIVEAHPKMLANAVHKLAYIRKEAHNAEN